MMIDEHGWRVGAAGDPLVARFPTVRTYELTTPAPLGIVWHTTDGNGGPGYAESLARRAQTFQPGAAVLLALVTRFGWTRDVCVYGYVDFDPQNREDPGPICKQAILPRVLDRVFLWRGGRPHTVYDRHRRMWCSRWRLHAWPGSCSSCCRRPRSRA